MPLTSARLICVAAFAVLSGAVSAKTNATCLKYLGGGHGDAECYSGLRQDLVAENMNLYKSLRATIPAGNVHAKLLNEYMAAQDDAVKYCALPRNAGAKWKIEHDGSMFPTLYEECIYDIRKAQNKFLKSLLEMAKW